MSEEPSSVSGRNLISLRAEKYVHGENHSLNTEEMRYIE